MTIRSTRSSPFTTAKKWCSTRLASNSTASHTIAPVVHTVRPPGYQKAAERWAALAVTIWGHGKKEIDEQKLSRRWEAKASHGSASQRLLRQNTCSRISEKALIFTLDCSRYDKQSHLVPTLPTKSYTTMPWQ